MSTSTNDEVQATDSLGPEDPNWSIDRLENTTGRFQSLDEELLYCFDKYMEVGDRFDLEGMTAKCLLVDVMMRRFPKNTHREFYGHKMIIDNMTVSVRADAVEVRVIVESWPYMAHRNFARVAAGESS